jgi:hypothetical protein
MKYFALAGFILLLAACERPRSYTVEIHKTGRSMFGGITEGHDVDSFKAANDSAAYVTGYKKYLFAVDAHERVTAAAGREATDRPTAFAVFNDQHTEVQRSIPDSMEQALRADILASMAD